MEVSIIDVSEYKLQFYLFKKKQRKRIWTLFFQLCDQFITHKNFHPNDESQTGVYFKRLDQWKHKF
ncbi:TPA: hypothetical protein ACGZ92_000444 [Elizabethkingia anophelis]